MSNYYVTSDLGFAAALITLGYKPARMDLDQKKLIFTFNDEENLVRQISTEYSGRDLMVDANTYFYAIKSLKSQFVQRMKNEKNK